jgi:DNA-binding NarL/FixJ family response regulator
MNMKPFRILLASMPAMLMEMIVQIIAREPEFTIVGEFAECPDLKSAMRRSRADLVIVGESFLAGRDVTAVLSSSYPVKIITIAEDGHCATLNELKPHRETLADVSATRLIAAIRTAIIPREFRPTLQ